MKAVIQRVNNASVEVEGKIVASIGLGLCVFLGIHKNDTKRDIDYIARKIVNLRLFDGDDQKRSRVSVQEKGYEILCRSQISLCADIQGTKLSHCRAMAPEASRILYDTFLDTVRQEYCPDKVKEGMFQVHSHVQINNDGPFTVILDSHEKNFDHNIKKTSTILPQNGG